MMGKKIYKNSELSPGQPIFYIRYSLVYILTTRIYSHSNPPATANQMTNYYAVRTVITDNYRWTPLHLIIITHV